jgi:hypothetical protein
MAREENPKCHKCGKPMVQVREDMEHEDGESPRWHCDECMTSRLGRTFKSQS